MRFQHLLLSAMQRVNYLIFTVRNEVAKVMFLQACVCPQGGADIPWEQTLPWEQTPPLPGLGAPPGQVHLPDQVHPPGPGTPPRTRYTPPGQVPSRNRPPRARYTPRDQVHPPRYVHCCGRYASYWNAFLSIEKCWHRLLCQSDLVCIRVYPMLYLLLHLMLYLIFY